MRPGAERLRTAAVFLGLLAFVAFLLWPLRHSGWWPFTHELDRYQVLTRLYMDAAAQGQWYPRWMPEMTGGYGYPLFVYYQPGFFLLALPFGLVGGAAFGVNAALFTLFLVGGIGAFLVGRLLAGNGAGAFAAALFLLTPYHFVNLYVRGDLSELMAALLMPWPVFGLLWLERCSRDGKPCRAAVLTMALGLAVIVISHPITAFFFVPVLLGTCALILFELPRPKRRRFATEAAGALVLAAALSSFYWFPVLQMGSQSQLSQVQAGEDYYTTERHAVSLAQLVSRSWGHGVSLPDSTDDTMSFQLGLPHLLLALGGVWWARRRRLFLWLGALYVLLALLMTTPVSGAWRLPLLEMVHFPWRLLSVLALLQMLCATGWFEASRPRPAWLGGRHAMTLGAFVLLGVFMWQPGIRGVPGFIAVQEPVLDRSVLRCRESAGVRAPTPERYQREIEAMKYLLLRTPEDLGRPVMVDDIEKNALALADATTWGFDNKDKGEWLPKTARPVRLPGPRRKMVLVPQGASVTPLEGNSSFRVRCSVATPDTGPKEALLNQLYFPGWRVWLDGKEVPAGDLERFLLPDGRMRLFLPATAVCELEAWYDGPPGWRLRSVLAILVIAAWVAFQFVLARRLRTPPAASPTTPSPNSNASPAD